MEKTNNKELKKKKKINGVISACEKGPSVEKALASDTGQAEKGCSSMGHGEVPGHIVNLAFKAI